MYGQNFQMNPFINMPMLLNQIMMELSALNQYPISYEEMVRMMMKY